MESAIGSSYGRHMYPTTFPNSNFRNYYNDTLYCRQLTGPKTEGLISIDN